MSKAPTITQAEKDFYAAHGMTLCETAWEAVGFTPSESQALEESYQAETPRTRQATFSLPIRALNALKRKAKAHHETEESYLADLILQAV